MGLATNNQCPPQTFPAPCRESKKARTAKLWKSQVKKLIQAAAIQNPLDLPPPDWRISVLSCMQKNAKFRCDEYIGGGIR